MKQFVSSKIFSLTVALALGCAVVSCKRRTVKDDTNPQSSPTSDDTERSAERRKYKKFQSYIQCTNKYTKDVMGILRDYFQWAQPDTGPTPQNIKNNSGIRAFYTDPKECIDSMRQTAKQKPLFADLDTPAAEYADALEKLAPLAKEMHRYYEFKDYQTTDTNLTKAQTLHKDLLAAANKFRSAIQQLGPVYDAIEDVETLRDLAKAKEKGKILFYKVMTLFVEAKKLRTIVDDIEWDTPTENPLLQKYEEQRKVMTQAYREVRTYWEDNQAEAQKQLDNLSGLTWYLQEAKDLFEASEELSKKFKLPPKKRFDDNDVRWRSGSMAYTIHGSPEKLRHAYSELVKKLNDLKFK